MNIVQIAKQYFKLDYKGNGVYQISSPTGELDSVVLWEKTNSYRRFSIAKSGGVREFLKYIVKLTDNEIEAEYGDIGEDNLTKSLRTYRHAKEDTGLSLSDVVFKRGYNQYIESRMISEETASYFNLEINNQDVAIPLYDSERRRVGSLYRNSSPEVKGDRYRTLLVNNTEKPCCWSFIELHKVKRDSVIVLVEGAWSAMRIHQVIKPKVPNIIPLATLGTNLTAELKDFLHEFPIISIIDDDTGGAKVVQSLDKWKSEKMKVESYIPTWKRLSLCEQSSYVDDLSDKSLLKLFAKIKQTSKILRWDK